jgi:hypothetical protein
MTDTTPSQTFSAISPSQGGETRDETGMDSRPVHDELFNTPGSGGVVPARSITADAVRTRGLACQNTGEQQPEVYGLVDHAEVNTSPSTFDNGVANALSTPPDPPFASLSLSNSLYSMIPAASGVTSGGWLRNS